MAEDNKINQKVAVGLLEKWGHEVVVVNNGQDAVEALEHETFDLVLMDVQMPQMDGFEATAAIRSSERQAQQHVPIIAMTAHAMDGDRQRCLDAGMHDYIAKPLDAEAFQCVVQHWGSRGKPQSTSTTPHAAPTVVLDRQLAVKRMGGDEELFHEMVQVFLDEGPDRLTAVREAFDKGDAEQLERAAHSLKGAIGHFAAQPAWDAAYEVEKLAEERRLDAVPDALVELERHVKLLLDALQPSVPDGQEPHAIERAAACSKPS